MQRYMADLNGLSLLHFFRVAFGESQPLSGMMERHQAYSTCYGNITQILIYLDGPSHLVTGPRIGIPSHRSLGNWTDPDRNRKDDIIHSLLRQPLAAAIRATVRFQNLTHVTGQGPRIGISSHRSLENWTDPDRNRKDDIIHSLLIRTGTAKMISFTLYSKSHSCDRKGHLS
ncbi:hypothetical protein DCAR_0313441 [Daucus carota subsp. sativus]|uniref:Uncharacterized protein n=1 Tax=Daucus carota subsp. sativus TaxID=79200 RepID=A0A166C0Y3_DAUCS|nr:hypothetical protein DCAR_0313441 [Daucus carota subsp. sativus]